MRNPWLCGEIKADSPALGTVVSPTGFLDEDDLLSWQKTADRSKLLGAVVFGLSPSTVELPAWVSYAIRLSSDRGYIRWETEHMVPEEPSAEPRESLLSDTAKYGGLPGQKLYIHRIEMPCTSRVGVLLEETCFFQHNGRNWQKGSLILSFFFQITIEESGRKPCNQDYIEVGTMWHSCYAFLLLLNFVLVWFQYRLIKTLVEHIASMTGCSPKSNHEPVATPWLGTHKLAQAL